jgi:hypothetical protein
MRDDAQMRATAEAVFGSAARGDADGISDRDILIVDDDPAVLQARSRVLEAEGWSVASHTFRKLNALSHMGALFVQHLKLECRVLVDRDGRLTDLLASFRPRTDYAAELQENARLASLAATVPEGPRGTLLAADILYVTVRNFGVLSLAERGIHAYAYTAIGTGLETERLIAPGGARAIASLRFLKCLYRAGESGSGGSTRRAVEDALVVLPRRFFPADFHSVPARDVLAMPAPCEPAAPYHVLRDLELRLLALQAIGGGDAVDGDIARLSKWIANPRAYASIAGRVAPAIRASMADALRPESHTRLGFLG